MSVKAMWYKHVVVNCVVCHAMNILKHEKFIPVRCAQIMWQAICTSKHTKLLHYSSATKPQRNRKETISETHTIQ